MYLGIKSVSFLFDYCRDNDGFGKVSSITIVYY